MWLFRAFYGKIKVVNRKKYNIKSSDEMKKFGEKFGENLKGGEVLELIGDVGVGKTTFTKGLAKGLGILDNVQSPSFTISRAYEGEKLRLNHYDFYRLNDAGIMAAELAENLTDDESVTVIEWSESVASILSEKTIRIEFFSPNENEREVLISNFKGEM